MTQIKGKFARGLRKVWPGRCLTTLLGLEGSDPGVAIPMGPDPSAVRPMRGETRATSRSYESLAED
eukprot:9488579-Pyramimonas_sp.AAC.1